MPKQRLRDISAGSRLRGLTGIGDNNACRRFLPMNCISWNVGHMAWQEQRYWLWRGQDRILLPNLNDHFANGAPACTPALAAVWEAWHIITRTADPWLDTLTSVDLLRPRAFVIDDQTIELTLGNLMQRVIYHYWYHTGENLAIRQLLGHTDLPEFVGDIDDEAPYRLE